VKRDVELPQVFGSYDRREYETVRLRQAQIYEDFCDHQAALDRYKDRLRAKLRAYHRALVRTRMVEYARLAA
jgi:hypothetical protein